MERAASPPEDWEAAPPCGVFMDRMVVCKTPLGPKFRVRPSHAFDVGDVLKHVRRTGLPLRAVIDLTSTTAPRYDDTAWGPGVAVHRVRCSADDAQDQPPSSHAATLFLLAMRECDGCAVVHCTHGFNRTGYMASLWAVVTGRAPSAVEAMQRFAAARGAGIYKEAFVQDLLQRCGEPPTARVAPWPAWRAGRRATQALPHLWRRFYEERAPRASLDRQLIAPVRSADDVGELMASRVCGIVQHLAARACGDSCRAAGFGGSLPVALGREHLPALRHDWAVSWKADGVRAMVVVLPGVGAFGLTRRMDVKFLGHLLPCALQHPLVLDTELVLVRGERGARAVLWAHDLLSQDGRSLARMPMEERCVRAAACLSQRLRLCGCGVRVTIARKGWWPASEALRVLEDPRNAPADGLVFQNMRDAHGAGLVLKWKREHTVDFMVTLDGELRLADDQPPDRRTGGLLNPDKQWCGMLVEARWVEGPPCGWEALSVRTDKFQRGNARRTAEDSFDKIMNPVTEQALQDATRD